MSDGLKLLDAILTAGSIGSLRDSPRELFIDEEVPVYNFIRTHYRRYGNLPALATIEEELGVQLPEAVETIDYYSRRVQDRKLYSVLREDFNALKECLRSFSMDDAREVINRMRLASRSHHTESDIRSLSEAAQDVLREYAFAHENPGISGVPVGWPHFDARVGGYQPGDLVAWVARMNQGKTYTLLRQATGAWRLGYSVLVVTMEMTIEQIARRLAAMQSGINPDYLRKGMLSAYAMRRLQGHIDSMVGAERFKMFSGGLKKRVGDVELLVQEYRPDIVFIDGAYMMHPDATRSMQKTEKASEVIDDLKRMALSTNVPIVYTTQFNRTAGKKGKDGSLENIAYTDAISTHSSLVISLTEAKGPEAIRRVRRLGTFLKGREGEQGSFGLHYNFRPMNFEEVEPEDMEEEQGTTATTAAGVDWMEG